MVYTVVCPREDCPGHFTTETKEEMFRHVQVHTEAAHPGSEVTDEQVEALTETT